MRGFVRLLGREARRVRLGVVVLALGGAVWAVVLRFTTGLRAPLCDRLPVTVGLVLAIAALALPVVSLAADGSLPRLAARRGGRLPRLPFLTAKWLACVGAWAVVAVWASGVALVLSPSAEALREWVRLLDGGWLWVLLLFAGSFFASVAMGRAAAAAALGAVFGLLPPLGMWGVFELPVGAPGGHGTKALVGGVATLWVFGMALLAFPARFATPATRWAKLLVQARLGACVAAAGLCMALVAPMAVLVACLRLGPGDADRFQSPQLSPDGRLLAFFVYLKGWPLDSQDFRAYVLETESGRLRGLTCLRSSGLVAQHPWSPQGRYLAYWTFPGPFGKAWRRLRRAEEQGETGYAILDTRTGERHEMRFRDYFAHWSWAEEGVISVWSTTSPRVGPVARRQYLEERYDVASRTWAEAARGMSWEAFKARARGAGRWREEALPGATAETGFWQLDDPKGRGLSLVARPLTSRQQPGRTLELHGGPGGVRRLGETDALDDERYAFSPAGRWLLFHAQDASWKVDAWLLNIGNEERRKLAGPGQALEWQPRFTPDDTRLVWLPGSAVVRRAGGEEPELCFYVQDLPSGALRRVDLPGRGAVEPESVQFAGPDNACLYFIREVRLWRVPLNGSAPEPLFPR